MNEAKYRNALMSGFMDKLAEMDDDMADALGRAIRKHHAIERTTGGVLGTAAGYQAGRALAGRVGGIAGAILGGAAGSEGSAKLMRYLERGS